MFLPAPFPSIVSLQPWAVALSSVPEIFAVVTPVAALNDESFSFQGRPRTFTVTETVAILQPVKEPVLIVPMPLPDRPLPFFSVPAILIEEHLATVPVFA